MDGFEVLQLLAPASLALFSLISQRAFSSQRRDAQSLRQVRVLTSMRADVAEQLATWRELLSERQHVADQDESSNVEELSPLRLEALIETSEEELLRIDRELESKKRQLSADASDPVLIKKREVTRWTVLSALVAPVIVDILILVVSLPVALRVVGEWPLPTALAVVFPATSGSGWAALIITFFVPHMAATCILGLWAFRLRKLDSEKFAKATETARSLLGGYIALLSLIASIWVIRVIGVGWFDNFGLSLKELTKPLLPILSVAAFVATFGPGYSKYAEGMAEIDKITVASEAPKDPEETAP
ncbi:hypothetical protein [Paenarthrobacter nicotinovorans]|uniref:hypothetical protein n=1 Tax=Paenarthrobacter nicotinovorans TaxID=29320 RepID=UPI001663FA9D|nr:hypothetical protein [Paenarthrobacter nicotinovorans]MBP2392784.1 hypothetical protein [Paenarthrobacter nicotinovorans]UKF00915.1 hypothetical protein LU808_09005 [Paenarthrobacter nicotinovorans]UKF05698.1 hypothetical protein JMY29_09040 [Paenarthrobacter nicotinovorans]